MQKTLYDGDQLDAATARRLMDEIEALWADLARLRIEIDEGCRGPREAALYAVPTYNRRLPYVQGR